jgi:hypothetical protein
MGKYTMGCKGAVVLAALLGLNACAIAEKAPEKPVEPRAKEITLVIADDGSISVKGSKGAIVEQACSLDPEAKDACPIYDKDKRVHVERIEPLVLMKYQVNPVCYLIGQYSQAILICYP